MASFDREILTYAFGHYSCHVAAHYFNIQEASFSYNPNFSTGINHDILFRDGLNVWQKQSYTPRLIAVDEVNSLRCLSKDGYYKDFEKIITELEDEAKESGKEVKFPRKEDQNEFIQDLLREKTKHRSEDYSSGKYLLKSSYPLQNSVVSWSDYLVAEYNNRTIVTLPRNTSYFESNDLFNSFDSGMSLWHKTDLNLNVEEYTRRYMEECNNLQGFHVLVDGNSGYGGVAAACLEHLKDEYGKKTVLTVPTLFTKTVEDGISSVQQKSYNEQLFSTGCSFSSLSENSEVVAPLSHVSVPWTRRPHSRQYKRFHLSNLDMYHTSGVLATALDLLTLPPRIRDSGYDMNNYYSNLNVHSRNFLSVGLCVPFPLKTGDSLATVLSGWQGAMFESLTPSVDLIPQQIDVQCISSKGIKDNDNSDDYVATKKCIMDYFMKMYPGTISGLVLSKPTLRIPRTFPAIFESAYNLSPTAKHEYGPLTEFYAMGGVHNSKEMGIMLQNMYDEIKRPSYKSFARTKALDSDRTDYGEIFDNLKNLSQNYQQVAFV